MELKEILDENIIDLQLEVQDKDQALRALSEKLLNHGYIDDIHQFMEDIYQREALGMTGIGNYIAIPHGKSDAVKKVGIAIGKTNKEIKWETLDGKGVRFLFLFAVSNDVDYARNHLVLLSEVARKLGNDKAIAKLQEVETVDELLELFL